MKGYCTYAQHCRQVGQGVCTECPFFREEKVKDKTIAPLKDRYILYQIPPQE